MTTFNTFQDSLIEYGAYTGSTGGIVLPPVSGGNAQYFTGTPQSVNNTTAVVYNLTLQGEVGDVFTMFLTGVFFTNGSIITPSFNGDEFPYTTNAIGGGSYLYESTVTIKDASNVVITNSALSSNAIGPGLGSGVGSSLRYGTGVRAMNMVAGVPFTITLQATNFFTVDSFSIFKYSPAL